MNLQQLRTLCELVDQALSVTNAAHATYRSQSSVTRQIQLLEKELGFELFARRHNRLLHITPEGRKIIEIARRMVHDAENMLRVGKNATDDEGGAFTVATTNFHARYALPRVIRRFVERYPRVRLSLRQSTPAQCHELVASGKADIAICAAGAVPDDIVQIPCYCLHRSVMTPLKHPLLKVKPLTLEAIAGYPLITFDEAFSGSWMVNKTFSDKGLQPSIVLSAVDADVSKIYVGMGLGIAIFASIAFDPKQDVNLRHIDARHLFKPSHLSMILRRRSHLRNFVFHFMRMFAPKVDRAFIEEALFTMNTQPMVNTALPEL